MATPRCLPGSAGFLVSVQHGPSERSESDLAWAADQAGLRASKTGYGVYTFCRWWSNDPVEM